MTIFPHNIPCGNKTSKERLEARWKLWTRNLKTWSPWPQLWCSNHWQSLFFRPSPNTFLNRLISTTYQSGSLANLIRFSVNPISNTSKICVCMFFSTVCKFTGDSRVCLIFHFITRLCFICELNIMMTHDADPGQTLMNWFPLKRSECNLLILSELSD